jgi:hypothetical protein
LLTSIDFTSTQRHPHEPEIGVALRAGDNITALMMLFGSHAIRRPKGALIHRHLCIVYTTPATSFAVAFSSPYQTSVVGVAQ